MRSWPAFLLASILSATCVTLALVPESTAAVIRVPADQPTIQAGINAALAGDMVLVAPGTYSGPGNQDLDFLGKNISVVSETGPQTTIIDPILDPQGVGRGFYLHSDEGQSALIEGFTIRDGGGPNAGGIFIWLASPTVRNCVLIGNTSPGIEVRGDGGGPYPPLPFPQPIIEQCVFEANVVSGLRFVYANGEVRDCAFTANVGLGIIIEGSYLGGGAPNFERCTISANTGGGIDVVLHGAPTCTDCVIRDHAAGSGPGVRDSSENGRSRFTRCTFARNAMGAYVQSGIARGAAFEDCTFAENSRAVYYTEFRGGEVRVRGCRFVNNSTTGSGGAIRISNGNLIVENSVFWNNGAGVSGGAVADFGSLGVTLRSCTIVGCSAPRGAGLSSEYMTRNFTLDRTIIAFSSSGEAIACGPLGIPSVTATCCDLYGNAGGDWVGCVAGMNGTNGNISADPQFCDLQNGDLTIADTSPCAPAQSGGCDLIGALPVSCQTSAVEPTTWGWIKATYSK